MHLRTYTRLVDEIKPDMAAYKKSKKEWGADAADADSLAYGKHDHVSAAGLDRMSKAMEKQIEKKKSFSRRRAHHHDADIDFINERNRVFNKKLERFYGKVTQDIKDNLERGTAV
jgi:pre-mRNA-splicing factor SYF2